MRKLDKPDFSAEDLKKDILYEARVLDIQSGFAEDIAEKVIKSVEKNLEKKKILTKSDINRIVVAELKKYDKDLAYIYHNRDKII